jgi:hypothetical protein
MSEQMNRREFLGVSAAGAGAALLGTQFAAAQEAEANWPPKMPPVKIYKVFIGRTGGIYLSRPTDEIEKFNRYLANVEYKLGDVKFVGGDLVQDAEIDQVLAKIKEADAVLLFHLCGHGGDAPLAAMTKIIDLGLPTAVFSQPFSGHGWMYFPIWQKQGKSVILLPSSDWGELENAARLLRVKPNMARTRILVIRGPVGSAAACDAAQVQTRLGTEMIPVTVEETLKAHQAVSLKDAEAEAQTYWISKAKRIVEPTKEEIINAARYYLAVKNLMIEKGAQAVTSSNCMGEPAKGCFAFSKLGDLGLVGACEGDMDSTLTLLMFNYAFSVPGFISDPVFDTASNALIHFHCTSATKMAGPASKRLPFSIRTQTDSDKGVALEVEMPVGQAVTCAKFVNLDTMVISTGDIFKITKDELGCRTQFWTRVKNADSMFRNWGAGVIEGGVMTLLHRVVFFGDRMQSVRDLGSLMGFKVVEEA